MKGVGLNLFCFALCLMGLGCGKNKIVTGDLNIRCSYRTDLSSRDVGDVTARVLFPVAVECKWAHQTYHLLSS